MAYYNKKLKKHFKSKASSKRADAGIWAYRNRQKKKPKQSSKNKPQKANNELEEGVRLRTTIVVIVIAILSYVGASQNILNAIIHFFANSISGLILNAVSKALISKSGFNWLKYIKLSFNIGSYEFSITFFAIAIFIVEKWLFP